MKLEQLKNAGIIKIQFYAPIYTAPYSGKSCVWYGCLYKIIKKGRYVGFTRGKYSKDQQKIEATTDKGILRIPCDRISPYVAPSYTGEEKFEGEIRQVEEYCIETGRTYYSAIEMFRYTLPPLFGIFPHSGRTELLAIYDEVKKNKPMYPLVPLFERRV